MTTRVPQGADQLRAEESATAAPQHRGDGPKMQPPLVWLDDRTNMAPFGRFMLKKIFPEHWSFLLGEIAMYSLIICLITGTFLTFWFVPSMGHVTYDGSFTPLQGIGMSEAYASTLNISFDIKGGLLIRQLHHWAALLFIVGIALHVARVFFTGAFRRPREINWVIGTVLALLAIIEGFAGYSLPDDLLSGTGIRAMAGFMQSAPVIGSYMTFFVFGGEFPGELIIPRLFIVHVLLLPALLVGLFTAHIFFVFLHKHTHFNAPGRTEDNVVGYPFMPVYIAKAGGFFFIVFGVTALISALVTINPVWAYGPYDPSQVTAGSQPDFYMWFSDGALRLLPGWMEFELFGFTVSPQIFLGSLVLLPLVFVVLGAYPFVEAWVTGDKREHHVLDRPRNAPVRTAIGAAAISIYLVLSLATINDIIAIKLGLSINDITIALRILFFVLPVVVYMVVKRLCLSLQRADRDLVLHGRETGRIVRTPEGQFYEVHEELDGYTRWPLVAFEPNRPLAAIEGPAADGHGVRRPRGLAYGLRRKVSEFYFKDRIEPVTPSALAAAHHHGEMEAIEGPGEPVHEIPGDDDFEHAETDRHHL